MWFYTALLFIAFALLGLGAMVLAYAALHLRSDETPQLVKRGA